MGTLSVSIQIFDKGFHRFKFNLKSGYHHIEIFPAHRKFLSFAWDFGTGSLRHFQFCVLLFSLSSSPFIFTKKEKSLRSVSLLENSFSADPFHVVLHVYSMSWNSPSLIAWLTPPFAPSNGPMIRPVSPTRLTTCNGGCQVSIHENPWHCHCQP